MRQGFFSAWGHSNWTICSLLSPLPQLVSHATQTDAVPTSVIRRSMNNISTVYGAIQKYTRNLFYNGQMEFQLHSSSVTYCSIYIFDSLWAKKTIVSYLAVPYETYICVEEKHPRLLVWGYINDVSRVGGGQFLTKGREVA